MKAEILTIGDEILIGQITNTNSVWIAQQLNLIGIKVVHMASVADDEMAIIDAFNAALTRADFVFITGGLGPTKDDITKKTFCDYFEDDNDVIDVQPAHPPRRSARLSAAAEASQACSLVSPLSLIVCDGFPVVT